MVQHKSRGTTGFFAGSTFLLVYINDLVDGLSSVAEICADDISLFTIVYDENSAAE